MYERPREKLQSRGAKNLIQAELIQLIIGSGTSKYPVAKLARQVAVLLKSNQVTYENLSAVPGLGEAKVCQLLASIELGARLAQQVSENTTHVQRLIQELLAEAQNLPMHTYALYLFDGAQRNTKAIQFTARKGEHYSLLVKRLFAEALVQSARSILLAIIVKTVPTQLNHTLLGIVRGVFETAVMLDIKVVGVYGISRKELADWGSYGQ